MISLDREFEENAKKYFKTHIPCPKCGDYFEVDKELSFLDEVSGVYTFISKNHKCKYE